MLRTTKSPARPRPTKHPCLSLTLLCLTTVFPGTHFAQTAAETDWQPATDLGQCKGRYVQREIPGDESGRIDATAGRILHVEDDTTTFVGDVRIRQDRRELTGDFATLDSATDTYTAEGNVMLRQRDLLLKGTKITGNIGNDTEVADSASFLMHQNRLRGSAGVIRRGGEDRLSIRDGEFTTCEPDDNTWSVSGREINLYPRKGYGVARDMKLKIRDLPIAYFPYFRFPIGDRQSGFLWPSAGQGSAGGTDIAIPYYFNLAPHYDATYTLRSIWQRGVMHEGEFRFMNGYSTNTIAGTFLPSDDKFDNRTVIDTGNPDFEKQDRWLTHFSHKGRQGPWSSMISYTRVSDIDYLEDLGGFTNTDSEFDQTLDRSDAPALLRQGRLAYTATNWRSTLELRSFQALNQVQPGQYETLPRFTLSGHRRFGRLQTEGLFQATVFDKSDDGDPEGTRLVADVSARLPFRKSWGFVTPGMRYIHRDYNLDDTLPGDRDDARTGTAIASLDAGLVFERTMSWRGNPATQTLEPRLYYLYVEEDFQDDLPFFDTIRLTPSYNELFRQTRYAGYDRIGDANRIAIGVTSNLYRNSDGRNFFTGSVGQMFHFEKRRVLDGDFTGNDPAADTSPVFVSLGAHIGKWRLRTTYEHDTGENVSNRGYFSATWRSANNAVFNFHYAMTSEAQQRGPGPRQDEETDISVFWPLGKTDTWSLIGRWNYGWDTGQTIESLVGLEYNDCCWTTRIVFRHHLEEPRRIAVTTPGAPTRLVVDRRADSGIYFEFQLKGLASLGGRLDNLLSNSIRGFTPER